MSVLRPFSRANALPAPTGQFMSIETSPIAHSSHHPLGRVTAINGSQATLAIDTGVRTAGDDAQVTVGRFMGIVNGKTVLIGLVTEVSEQQTNQPAVYRSIARLDLIGEIHNNGTETKFQRGVADYPIIGDPAALVDEQQLRLIYGGADKDRAYIGDLQQDTAIGVNVHIDDLVSKHFAILGTTGVGKSSSVAIILSEILKARSNLRIFLVDPHNEYGPCFGDKAQVLTPRNLRLPFWLFNFEEVTDAFFGGRPGVEEEVEILSEVIPLAKAAYLQYRNNQNERSLTKKRDPRDVGFTADTPVPYRIEDLINLLDERMGKLENRTQRVTIHRLMSRIQTFRNHPRYAFMFEGANIGGDTMAEIIGNLFRLPIDNKPMTIMQLAGFPAEVVDSVVSVLCRMAFDFGLWSDGVSPLLFVCEEAHRYAPADKKIGFGPTRRALSRIAKEGRKYGVFLGLVTQRPAEIDPTIISQCSTLFVMRLSNDRDQALIRSAVSDAAANLLSFIPTLGTREVFAFGAGVALPTRMRFKELAADRRPNSEAAGNTRDAAGANLDRDLIGSVIERWRSASMSHKVSLDDDVPSPFEQMAQPPAAPAAAPPVMPSPSVQPAQAYDPQRARLLRKPLDGGAPVAPPPQAPAAPPAQPRPPVHAMPPRPPAALAPAPHNPHVPVAPGGYPPRYR
jgi:DNA helicase HerA-like ATPase